MSSYINAKFICNEYYLMGKLLTDSYKIKNILGNGNYPNLNTMSQEEKTTLSTEFERFMQIAVNMPCIEHLLNFGDNFDKLPDEEKANYNAQIFDELEQLSEVTDDVQFTELEGEEVLEAFDRLRSTEFYRSMLKRASQHKEMLQQDFEESMPIAEETLAPILEKLESKSMEILVLPPEIFDVQVTLNSKGDKVKSVASYPSYFDRDIPKARVVAMLHEMIHTYIPLDKNSRFQNPTQELVYAVINHSLVELCSNCELGMNICGLDSYFKMAMHNEILKHSFKDNEGIKKDYFVSQGINFPPEFEFESLTEYSSITEQKTRTPKDELSNDKIRGIVYPYFLAFKNRNNQNSIQQVLEEMARDKESIVGIYGEEFYERISNPAYLESVLNSVRTAESIVGLNDIVARDAFGIEKRRTITPTQIGKACFISDKAVSGILMESAQRKVNEDTKQMTSEREEQVSDIR